MSNSGGCLKLFAPGVNILSAWGSGTVPMLLSGTSMAAPHVAGVAARYLQTNPGASPAQVWAAIHSADDVPGTAGWPGIPNRGAGSPNELLVWESEPHLNLFMLLAILALVIVLILVLILVVWWYRARPKQQPL